MNHRMTWITLGTALTLAACGGGAAAPASSAPACRPAAASNAAPGSASAPASAASAKPAAPTSSAAASSAAPAAASGSAPASASAASSGAAEAGSGDIKIGMPADLTGFLGNAGTTAKNGAQLAVDEINASGGVKGRKLNLDVSDDKTDPAQSTLVVRRMVEQDKVNIIVNATSSTDTLAHMQVTKASGPVEISVYATDPKVTAAGDPFMFVGTANDTGLGQAIADYAVKDKNTKKFAVFNTTDAYGQDISKVFADRVKADGGTVTDQEPYAPDTKDFKALLLKAAGTKPDALFLGGTVNDSALIVKQARDLGIQMPFFGSDTLVAQQFAQVAGAAANDTIFSALYSPAESGAKNEAFVKAYSAKYNAQPDVYAANAYNIIHIVADVFGSGASDSKAIAGALHSRTFQGLTGDIKFGQDGSVSKPVDILQVQNGKQAFLKSVSPS